MPQAPTRPKPTVPGITHRVFPPRGFEPAGYRKPWGGLPSTEKLPWMLYGANAKDRPSTSEAMNRVTAAFHRAEMQKFVDAANADGVLDERERLALTTAKERDLAWMKKTPDELAEDNKGKTLMSDIFHRKPANELWFAEAMLQPTEVKFKHRPGDNRPIWHSVF